MLMAAADDADVLTTIQEEAVVKSRQKRAPHSACRTFRSRDRESCSNWAMQTVDRQSVGFVVCFEYCQVLVIAEGMLEKRPLLDLCEVDQNSVVEVVV